MIAHSTALFEVAHDPSICLSRFTRGDAVTQHWPNRLFKFEEEIHNSAPYGTTDVCRFCGMPIEKSERYARVCNGWISLPYLISEQP